MKFSVIVPVYNVAEYLPQCVESLLAQECGDYEIILVDDGSTDDSGKLCDGYAADHPGLIRVIHQENGGLGAARNTGLEGARGEYLLFVDSDDYLTENALSCLSRHVEETNLDLYIFGFSHLRSGRIIPGEGNPLEGEKPFALKDHPELLRCLPSAWMRLWRRSLFDDPTLRFPGRAWYEDLRTTPKAQALCESIQVLPERLYVYRVREGSIMNNANLARNREIIDAMEDLLGWFDARGILPQYQKELEAVAIDHLLMAASVRVAKVDPRHPLLGQFREYMEKRFPHWRENPSIMTMTKLRRLALRVIEKKRYALLGWLFRMKG